MDEWIWWEPAVSGLDDDSQQWSKREPVRGWEFAVLASAARAWTLESSPEHNHIYTENLMDQTT